MKAYSSPATCLPWAKFLVQYFSVPKLLQRKESVTQSQLLLPPAKQFSSCITANDSTPAANQLLAQLLYSNGLHDQQLCKVRGQGINEPQEGTNEPALTKYPFGLRVALNILLGICLQAVKPWPAGQARGIHPTASHRKQPRKELAFLYSPLGTPARLPPSL